MTGAIRGRSLSVALIVAALSVAASLLGSGHAFAGKPLPSESLYRLPSTWTAQNGTRLQLDRLAGRPRFLALVFTSCRYTCPMTVAALRRIERALPEKQRAQAGFVLVSFDPARDTPDVLAKFAASQHLDPARWTLLHGDEAAVRELTAALGFHYKKTASGDFTHDTLIVLLDDRGVEVQRTKDLQGDPAPFLKALAK